MNNDDDDESRRSCNLKKRKKYSSEVEEIENSIRNKTKVGSKWSWLEWKSFQLQLFQYSLHPSPNRVISAAQYKLNSLNSLIPSNYRNNCWTKWKILFHRFIHPSIGDRLCVYEAQIEQSREIEEVWSLETSITRGKFMLSELLAHQRIIIIVSQHLTAVPETSLHPTPLAERAWKKRKYRAELEF